MLLEKILTSEIVELYVRFHVCILKIICSYADKYDTNVLFETDFNDL